MRDCLFLFALLMFFSSMTPSLGQSANRESQSKEYLAHLKDLEIDTVLIIKSGCTGCEIKYKNTNKVVSDGETIFVLSQEMGAYKLISFDGSGQRNTYLFKTCTLFDTIHYYKTILKQKEQFYKKELEVSKKIKFFPPGSGHYNYNQITILLPEFTFDFLSVNDKFDYMGFSRDSEKWFRITQKIFKQFFGLWESVRDYH